MNRLELRECSPEEIKQYKDKFKLREIKFDDGYSEILIQGIPRALISFSPAGCFKEWKDAICIDAFEVFEKNKRFGSTIVDELKDEKIVLIPDLSAVEFWEKHGFKKFDNEYYTNF